MSARQSAFLAVLLFFGSAAPAWAGDVPGEKSPEASKLDAFGDPLPPGAYARFGTLRLRHDAKAVAFLDDKTIVSVGSSVRFWDAATGRLIREHRHEKMADADTATIAADGKRAIVSCTNQVYRVWDIATGKLLREIKFRHQEERDSRVLVGFISASADGSRWVAAEAFRNSKGVMLFRMAAYSLQAEPALADVPGEFSGANGFAISPDGSCAVTASLGPQSEDVLTYWDARSGKKLHDDKPGVGRSLGVRFLPDGKALLITGEGGTALRTLEGKDLWHETAQMDEASIVCVTSNRIVLRVHYRQMQQSEIRVLDAASGKLLGRWTAPEEGPAGAVSPDGKRLVYAVERAIRVANLIDGKELVPATGHSGDIVRTCVTPDGQFMFSIDGVERDVLMWDVETGKIVRRLEGNSIGGTCLALSPDGKRLACVGGDELRVWEMASGKVICKLTNSDDEQIKSICFLADSQRIAVQTGEFLWIAVHDCRTSAEMNERSLELNHRFEGMIRKYDGRLLAVCRHFDPNPLVEPRFQGFDIWDILARRIVLHVDGDSAWSCRIAVSRDGRMLGTSGRGETRVWELATGQLRTKFKNPPTKMLRRIINEDVSDEQNSANFTFSPDGLTIAVAGRGGINVDLWDLPAVKWLGSLRGHELPVSDLEFTPDGRRLLTGSEDSTILGWDMTRPEWRSRSFSSNLSDKDLATHWDRLRNAKADEAYRSKWALVGDPKKTVEFLRTRLPSTAPILAEQIKSWITDLDANQYSVRERAQRELQDYFDQTEDALRKALTTPVSAEVRNRINRIIDASFAAIPQLDQLRDLRAIEVLEQIGTPGARDLIRRLAKSDVPTTISRDAAQSLRRLEQRPR